MITTKRSDTPLCATCRNALVMRGRRLADDATYCRAIDDVGSRVLMHVTQCSAYDDRRVPPLYRLQEVAWDILDKGGRKIGFRSPAQRKRANEGQPDGPLLAPWD